MSAHLNVTKAITPRERREFVTFPWRVYRHDPLWVPPLLPLRAKIIDRARGPFFERGVADFFIARHRGVPLGTICAAEDRVLNDRTGLRECLFGFFESVNEEAAHTLFEHAAQWAVARGLASLVGPFNLDPEDSYGILVEGRDRPPALLCGHTPAAYQAWFERSGFLPLRGDNLAFELRLDDGSPAIERVLALAERVQKKGWIKLRQLDARHWEPEIALIHVLLNRALAHLADFRPYEEETVRAMLEPFREIADPELVLFAEVEGETVGWVAGVPNMNEVAIHLNGLRYPWDHLRALRWSRYRPRCLAVKSILVHPDHWRSGVAVLLLAEIAKRGMAKGYDWADLSLTSEDNPYTPALAEKMGARVYKRYRTYKKDLLCHSPAESCADWQAVRALSTRHSFPGATA